MTAWEKEVRKYVRSGTPADKQLAITMLMQDYAARGHNLSSNQALSKHFLEGVAEGLNVALKVLRGEDDVFGG